MPGRPSDRRKKDFVVINVVKQAIMLPRNVLIIGGGWAGLSAAIHLVDQGLPVTVIEAAPQLGGRARTIFFSDKKVDNGQHLMIGAYHRVKTIVEKINLSSDLFLTTPLRLHLYSTYKHLKFNLPNLRWPLNLLIGLIFTNSFTLSERWALLKFCRKLLIQRFETTSEMSVSDFLYRHQLPDRIIRDFFDPLCLAALSTPPAYASAEVFLAVLQDTFAGHTDNTKLLFARKDLSDLFGLPAQNYIEAHGGKVLTNTRALKFMIENNRIKGVGTSNGWMHSDHVILATSFQHARLILEQHDISKPIAERLQDLKSEQITTVYLQYDHALCLELPMIGMLGTWSQWVFDRGFANQPGLFAVVMTGIGPHMEVDNQTLITQISRELNAQFPKIPLQANAARVIREKRAAFSCRVGVNTIRPTIKTELPGLWLAGDYTQTGYPASLEGAVKSGQQCAEQLLKVLNERNSMV
ncbi:MAG: hydroxysqualene dehydroxylase HpnE [Gammaproteobacteria bacterium]